MGSGEAMKDTWHRLGVYLDLREDPDPEAGREADRSSSWLVRTMKGILVLVLVSAVLIVFFCVLALIVHLISGDVSLRRVLGDGLRFFAVAFSIAVVAFFLGRWLYWFADRWVRPS
jgi:hypothetical protein